MAAVQAHSRDYKFSPFYVKKALEWLTINNHLYNDTVVEWPLEQLIRVPTLIDSIRDSTTYDSRVVCM